MLLHNECIFLPLFHRWLGLLSRIMSDSDDDAAILEWSMLDDRQWRLRPGFQFPHPMTYEEMCQFVNMEARKVGSDPFRPKKRRSVMLEGCSVPRTVSFYCNHGRAHGDQTGRRAKKAPEAKRSGREQEARHILYSECPCCFVVVPDPSVFVGANGDSDEDERELLEEEGDAEGGQKKGSSSHSLAIKWLIPESGTAPGAHKRPGKPIKNVWDHQGHPKRTLQCGDVTKDMHEDIRLSAKHNVALSSLQASLLDKHKVFITMSQLRYTIEQLSLGVVGGRIVTASHPGYGNQAQNLVNWVLEQDDTYCCLLVEDVDRSSDSQVCLETWFRNKDADSFCRKHTDFDGKDVLKPKDLRAGTQEEMHNNRVYDINRFITLTGGRRVFLIAIAWTHDYEVRTFSAFPDLLVFDGKMNTNKQRQELFCGVGVDGAWRNSVLFRAWLPNMVMVMQPKAVMNTPLLPNGCVQIRRRVMPSCLQ